MYTLFPSVCNGPYAVRMLEKDFRYHRYLEQSEQSAEQDGWSRQSYKPLDTSCIPEIAP
jgi:hypothetical protein